MKDPANRVGPSARGVQQPRDVVDRNGIQSKAAQLGQEAMRAAAGEKLAQVVENLKMEDPPGAGISHNHTRPMDRRREASFDFRCEQLLRLSLGRFIGVVELARNGQGRFGDRPPHASGYANRADHIQLLKAAVSPASLNQFDHMSQALDGRRPSHRKRLVELHVPRTMDHVG